MNKDPHACSDDEPVKQGNPAGDIEDDDDCRELKLDADERTPEEAGYGYGV